jgi:hypothetical protein
MDDAGLTLGAMSDMIARELRDGRASMATRRARTKIAQSKGFSPRPDSRNPSAIDRTGHMQKPEIADKWRARPLRTTIASV